MKKPFAIMLALIMVLAFIPAAATTAATSGAEITKVWDDEGHQNERPQSVTVQLLEGDEKKDEITLTAEANWTGSFSYSQESGKTYTIKEVDVPANYTPSYTAPVEEKLTVKDWGKKITPANNPTYTLTGNIVVANKGGSYYIWTQDELTEPQENKLKKAVDDANLEGLGKALEKANSITFAHGVPTAPDASGVSIQYDNNNNTTINFSEPKDWSLFYEGTLIITPATGWIVKNTYEAPEQTTYTLDVSKTVEGLPDNVNRPSPITVSLMNDDGRPVSSARLTWDANNNKYSGKLENIPEGTYTIVESGAGVKGYTYKMQAFVPGVVALSVEPVTSAPPVNTPLPSTSPEPVLAELQNNIIEVTANGELILKNTYTKTESDPETVTISIPIYKEVRQGGNTAPGKQTFTFVLSDFGVDYAAPQVTVANNTIETNGAGYYETVMTVTIDKKNFGNLLEGFKVTERNDGAPYWAYDATEWYVMPQQDNEDKITGCIFYTAGDQTPYNDISFTNIYTYNYNGGYYPAPVRPVQPAPLPPQTGDMPLWYAVAQFLGLVK